MKTKFTRFFIILIVAVSVFIGAGFYNDNSQTVFTSSAYSQKTVYLGGKPLGVEIGAEGVMIAGTAGVVTANGVVYPTQNLDVKCGDILLSVAGKAVVKPSDISLALKNSPSKKVVIKLKRGQNAFETTIDAAIDAVSGEKRLGIMVKDDITGIGTLTFVTENMKYGALGHHISDGGTGLKSELNRGKIFNCEITGANKATNGRAGELIGNFNRFGAEIGTIGKNTDFGIFGNYMGDVSAFAKIDVADEGKIKHGKAYIYTCVKGGAPDYYTIDIIKTYPQETATTKSMVISVTDKRLIESTGGIVQGMSGSPIVQNGKLIGAVTHVFVNDATKGYGVYINWMLDNVI